MKLEKLMKLGKLGKLNIQQLNSSTVQQLNIKH